MEPCTAWLLNFEADIEFACKGPFTPSRGLASQLQSLRRENADRLLRGGDVLIPSDGGWSVPDRVQVVRTWCPTPMALTRLGELGMATPPGPEFEVLREANSRRFCAGLGQALPGAFFATRSEDMDRGLKGMGITDTWLLKQNFGTSGRGQLRVRELPLDAEQTSWIQSSLKSGGLQVEPLVEIEQEFAIHGWLFPEGGLHVGESCVQSCSERGVWKETRLALPGQLSTSERQALAESAREVGASLREIGYFGPFGVDAFRWVGADGIKYLQPRVEINARFTLGWRAGFSGWDVLPWNTP